MQARTCAPSLRAAVAPDVAAASESVTCRGRFEALASRKVCSAFEAASSTPQMRSAMASSTLLSIRLRMIASSGSDLPPCVSALSASV